VTAAAPLVALRGIRKAFPGVVANDGVDLDLEAGAVHALLGENGAGKTTLMNVLAGLYRPDAGTIHLDGRRVELDSPRDAYRHGIGMVHQHFRLVPSLTVAENVLLGLEAGRAEAPGDGGPAPGPGSPRLGWRLAVRDHRAHIAEVARGADLPVDVDAPIWQLAVGQQQRVEIVKMLYRGVRVLILDEPTAALTPQEADALFATLRGMAARGRAIVLISHKLGEVMAVADRISVMRRGRRVATLRPAETDARRLAALMVGEGRGEAEPAAAAATPARTAAEPPVLAWEALRVEGDRGRTAVRGMTLAVHPGEIVGIAGVAGNGQGELAEALAGLRPARDGRILLEGQDVTAASVRRRTRLGLRYLPADRHRVGAAPDLSIAENLVLKSFREPVFGTALWTDRRRVRAHARRLMNAFRIVGGEPDSPVRLLSGGNLQKVLLARELTLPGRALVAESPTRGLDVGATAFVHQALRAEARQGHAVLLISEDLDELRLLCDRIAVMHGGEVMGVLPRGTATREELGLLMAGTRAR
jgi:simple sugar transport system ATP-binding protein